MNRPKHHTQCGYCWGMGTLGKEYAFPHKHTDAVFQRKLVSFTEEVEEPYILEQKKLSVVPDIPFSSTKEMVGGTYSIKDVLNLQPSVEEIRGQPKWLGIDSNELGSVLEKSSFPYSAVNFSHIKFNEVIVEESQVLEEFTDVVGYYPNVPLFLMGYPLDMFNNHRRNERKIERQVTIWVNVAIDSRYSPEQYHNRGLAAFYIAEYLSSMNIHVFFRLVDASYIAGEVMILQSSETLDFRDANNCDLLCRLLTDVSFERVRMIKYKHKLMDSGSISGEWKNGMGYEIRNKDLRPLLDGIKENDILINNIEEFDIHGTVWKDDYQKIAERCGLL